MRVLKRILILVSALLTGILLYIFTPTSLSISKNLSNGTSTHATVSKSGAESALWWFCGAGSEIQCKTPPTETLDQVIADSRKLIKRQKNQDAHLKEWLSTSQDYTSFDFSRCRMSNCFDFDRCRQNGSLRVHIAPVQKLKEDSGSSLTGESNAIHQRILKFVSQSKYYEPDASKACITILSEDTLDRDPLSQSFVPYARNLFNAQNQYGMNYLIFNLYSGSWPDYRENDFGGLNIGAAILAKASNSLLHHRPRFDISIPLFSHTHGNSNQTADTDKTDESNRPYFITFKGKRYVVGSGSETRNSLHHLNNRDDVITLTTCRHGKKWRDTQDGRCAEDESTYNEYDFNDLMKGSTFCLTPRGRRLGSFRFLEALAHGCIPVVLSDGWTWPFDDLIDWSDAAIQFNENLVLLVPDLLRDVQPEKVTRMRRKCRILYEKIFSSIEKIVTTTLDIIEKRVKNQLSQPSQVSRANNI